MVDLIRTRPQKLHIRECYTQAPLPSGDPVALLGTPRAATELNLYDLSGEIQEQLVSGVSGIGDFWVDYDERIIYYCRIESGQKVLKQRDFDGTFDSIIVDFGSAGAVDRLNVQWHWGIEQFIIADDVLNRTFTVEKDGSNLVQRDSFSVQHIGAAGLDDTTYYLAQNAFLVRRRLSNGSGLNSLSGAATGITVNPETNLVYYINNSSLFRLDLDLSSREAIASRSGTGLPGMCTYYNGWVYFAPEPRSVSRIDVETEQILEPIIEDAPGTIFHGWPWFEN